MRPWRIAGAKEGARLEIQIVAAAHRAAGSAAAASEGSWCVCVLSLNSLRLLSQYYA